MPFSNRLQSFLITLSSAGQSRSILKLGFDDIYDILPIDARHNSDLESLRPLSSNSFQLGSHEQQRLDLDLPRHWHASAKQGVGDSYYEPSWSWTICLVLISTALTPTVCAPARFFVSSFHRLQVLSVSFCGATVQGLFVEYGTGPDGRPCHVTPPSPFFQSRAFL